MFFEVCRVTEVTFGEAMDSGDKATNKAMSVALKYLLIQTFQIPVTGEANDGDSAHETFGDVHQGLRLSRGASIRVGTK